MARPTSRRPGQNRRAQYGVFASYVITIFGTIVGLFVVIISMADPVGFSFIRSAAAEVTRPIALGLKWTTQSLGTLEEGVSAYIKAGSQNIALRRQVDMNRAKLIEAEGVAQENARLKKLLNLVKTTDNVVATGSLIGSSSVSTRRIARLSVGTRQNVAVGMPVRASEGLIGRVIMTGFNTSEVLLLTDSQSVVPVRRSTGSTAAVCTGRDDGTVEIKALGPDANPFKVGDIVVTSGTGGLYNPNVPVAVVIRLQPGAAIGVPLASASRVFAVMVQRPFDAALEPPQIAGENGQLPPRQKSTGAP